MVLELLLVYGGTRPITCFKTTYISLLNGGRHPVVPRILFWSSRFSEKTAKQNLNTGQTNHKDFIKCSSWRSKARQIPRVPKVPGRMCFFETVPWGPQGMARSQEARHWSGDGHGYCGHDPGGGWRAWAGGWSHEFGTEESCHVSWWSAGRPGR